MPLAKRQRIRSAAAVSRIFKKIRPLSLAGLTVRVDLEPTQQKPTFAVVVPVATAPKAVQRNAIRRRFTAVLQRLLGVNHVNPHASVVVTVRDVSGIKNTETTMVSLMKKSGILLQ